MIGHSSYSFVFLSHDVYSTFIFFPVNFYAGYYAFPLPHHARMLSSLGSSAATTVCNDAFFLAVFQTGWRAYLPRTYSHPIFYDGGNAL